MQAKEPSRFEGGELAVVLSHYDLGVIESVTDFPRGSRRSPKVGIVCERGKYLLKRRTAVKAPPDRLRFTHLVQRRLIESGFPAPRLSSTRHGEPYLQIRDHVYELFEFVPGEPYRHSVEETRDAGVMLARFHQWTEPLAEAWDGFPRGDYHDAPGVRTGLCSIGSSLSAHDSFSGDEAELQSLLQFLLGAYDRAADAVKGAGYASWPEQITHADWHPGNLVFRKQAVVGVVDFDAMRLTRRLTDVGNGALQFSMIASGDPASWPAEYDAGRLTAFLEGYRSAWELTEPQVQSVFPLMIEALIAECVAPITETGTVGRWSGFRVLQMARRKVAFLEG